MSGLTWMVCLKEFYVKVYFEKCQQRTKKHAKLPSMQRVISNASLTDLAELGWAGLA